MLSFSSNFSVLSRTTAACRIIKNFQKRIRRGGGWVTGPQFERFASLLGHPITPGPGHQLVPGFLLGGIRDSRRASSEARHLTKRRETAASCTCPARGVANFSHCAPHPTHLEHEGKLRPRDPERFREEICLRRPGLNPTLVCGVPGNSDPALRPQARYSPAQCRGVPSGPGPVTARGARVAELQRPRVRGTGPCSGRGSPAPPPGRAVRGGREARRWLRAGTRPCSAHCSRCRRCAPGGGTRRPPPRGDAHAASGPRSVLTAARRGPREAATQTRTACMHSSIHHPPTHHLSIHPSIQSTARAGSGTPLEQDQLVFCRVRTFHSHRERDHEQRIQEKEGS